MPWSMLSGKALITGRASGPVLHADVGLSFMGGVDAATGRVTDVHHPLCGESVAGKVLAIPSGRGSCSGSLVIFELLMNGHAPAALVFRHKETILTLGVLIAGELFHRAIPVLQLDEAGFAALSGVSHARIEGDTLWSAEGPMDLPASFDLPRPDPADFRLSELDCRLLAGDFGEAAQTAMRIVLQTARIEGATELVDVDMAHLDGVFYQGPAGLKFARRLCDMGARVRVPTTMNALCVDRRQWRAQGVPAVVGEGSDALADAYVEMGARPTYTCAPYLLEPRPRAGQNIAWGESNAVMFANSVLGARTLKYPDYLDVLVALTGRAPAAECYLGRGRRAAIRIDLPPLRDLDDLFFPLLGYHIGKIATNEIPLICGLEDHEVGHDDLKAFGAAFATTSAAPMFHILGITPEAGTATAVLGDDVRHVQVSVQDLAETWAELNIARTPDVDLVALGNPHFSLTEIAALARLCAGRQKAEGVRLTVTCGRDVHEQARAEGLIDTISAFGGEVLNDTCWCFIGEPVVPKSVRNIATNSGKYAHYGPPAVGKGFHFASLARCVEAACTGRIDTTLPAWCRRA
ncbi:cis-3-hydroxy-L-proline dehydratase [Tabrizicola flagellatus]|uniref:cis-3-hydroxy-L-proline dehydratase n=1 Tax=Tabrizicola flagellatus TaxID=2593021 RepID=UPI0011F3722A|nr:aconitase family protein [Tabrizicola flagellatus]